VAQIAALESKTADLLKQAQAHVDAHKALKAEYDAIVLKVTAGVPVTQAVIDQLATLAPALIAAEAKVNADVQAVKDLAAAREKAAADGLKWYWQIPWAAIITGAAGLAVGRYPLAKGAIQAAGAVGTTLVKAIRDYNALPDTSPLEIKQVVATQALADGNADALHALVQTLDPTPACPPKA
jgi:nucleoid-associated protein YgaU